MENIFYVYMYLRSYDSKHGAAGSPYYIGKGQGNRAFDKNRHSKPPSDLSRIVFAATSMWEWDAHQLEMFLISRYGRIDLATGILRNLTDGGEGKRGHIPSAESRAKQSEWMKAHPNRGNELCPKWPKGKPRAEETKVKQSASWTPELREAMSQRKRGLRHSPEVIEKIAAQKRGVKASDETKTKMTEAHKQSWSTGERHVALEELMRKREDETGMSAIERRRKRKRENFKNRMENEPEFAAKQAARSLAIYRKKKAMQEESRAEMLLQSL